MKGTSADALASSPRLLRLVLAIFISLTLALGGCDRDGQSGNSETKKSEAAPAEVNAVTIVAKTLPVTFEAVGQTEGSREVEVRSRAPSLCRPAAG